MTSIIEDFLRDNPQYRITIEKGDFPNVGASNSDDFRKTELICEAFFIVCKNQEGGTGTLSFYKDLSMPDVIGTMVWLHAILQDMLAPWTEEFMEFPRNPGSREKAQSLLDDLERFLNKHFKDQDWRDKFSTN